MASGLEVIDQWLGFTSRVEFWTKLCSSGGAGHFVKS